MLETQRFQLVAVCLEFIEAVLRGDRERAGRLVDAVVPNDWPIGKEAAEGLPIHLECIRKDRSEENWRIYLILDRGSRDVIGSLSFKGPPRPDGTVELGWGIIPRFRGQGIAAEATAAIARWAFSHAEVSRVIATIPDDNTASMAVARRLGMCRTNEERGDLPVWELKRTTTKQTRIRPGEYD